MERRVGEWCPIRMPVRRMRRKAGILMRVRSQNLVRELYCRVEPSVYSTQSDRNGSNPDEGSLFRVEMTFAAAYSHGPSDHLHSNTSQSTIRPSKSPAASVYEMLLNRPSLHIGDTIIEIGSIIITHSRPSPYRCATVESSAGGRPYLPRSRLR